jgi:hypothetical protein
MNEARTSKDKQARILTARFSGPASLLIMSQLMNLTCIKFENAWPRSLGCHIELEMIGQPPLREHQHSRFVPVKNIRQAENPKMGGVLMILSL